MTERSRRIAGAVPGSVFNTFGRQRKSKMKYTALAFLSSIVSSLVAAACSANDSVESVQKLLIPKPQRIQIGTGTFDWDTEIPLIVEPDNSHDRFAAETLVAACRQRKLAIPKIRPSQKLNGEPGQRILIGDPSRNWPLHQAMQQAGISLSDEVINGAYVLDVTPKRILIAAGTSAGVYYGVQTLIQLLPQRQRMAVPSLRITDWSLIRLRGVSIDMYSGEVYKTAMLEETIRRLAHYKLNAMVLYLEDAFLFPSHPDIGEDRDRLTTQQVRKLDALAREHHLELIPCYNSPAHMGNTLKHPNYAHLVEGEKNRGVINVTHPEPTRHQYGRAPRDAHEGRSSITLRGNAVKHFHTRKTASHGCSRSRQDFGRMPPDVRRPEFWRIRLRKECFTALPTRVCW